MCVCAGQTVVLMLFNEMDTLSYSEIKEASRIEDKELKRTLQSLSVRATPFALASAPAHTARVVVRSVGLLRIWSRQRARARVWRW